MDSGKASGGNYLLDGERYGAGYPVTGALILQVPWTSLRPGDVPEGEGLGVAALIE